ncbi:hypothetical protein [Mucilaginibacter sp. NFX135]|uniref:hypothetical protein n=1 Tax=Mucilaginibacter sp. NFX135 TaxID=3402687 RepID=UPI003AFB61E0
MRSQSLVDFHKSVSELNNHLSHTLFVFKQFKIDNQTLIGSKPNLRTIAAYKENEMAPQFDVTLNKLAESADVTLDYILDTFFVFINTRFEVYLIGLQNYVKANFDDMLPEPPDNHIYEKVLENFGINPEVQFGTLFTSTFSYYKLRRNATMHRDKKRRYQGLLERLIKGTPDEKLAANQLSGAALNNEWQSYVKGQTKCHAVRNTDFTNKDLTRFGLPELIDVFNFYRLFAELIDSEVMGKQDRVKLLKYCHKCYKEFYNFPDDLLYESFAPKFLHICKLKLNLIPEQDEIKKYFKKDI